MDTDDLLAMDQDEFVLEQLLRLDHELTDVQRSINSQAAKLGDLIDRVRSLAVLALVRNNMRKATDAAF